MKRTRSVSSQSSGFSRITQGRKRDKENRSLTAEEVR
jgi:hypothetical protein